MVTASFEVARDSPAKVAPWSAIHAALREVDLGLRDASRDRDIHSIHPYPAKFVGALPGTLLDLIAQPHASIVDPFVGSGTTLVEALRRGHSAAGFDANPIAVLVAAAKVARLSEADRLRVHRIVGRVHKGASLPLDDDNVPVQGRNNGRARFWFPRHAFRELKYIRDLGRLELSGETLLLWTAALSAIVVRYSHQDGETRYSWVDKKVAPWDVFAGFRAKISEALKASANANAEYERASTTGASVSTIDYSTGNCALGNAVFDCAIFSPPYPNTFDYHLYHRLRLLLFGHDPAALRRSELGAHLKYDPDTQNYLEGMRRAMTALYAALRPGGVLAMVVGDSIIRGNVYDNAADLAQLLHELRFREIGRYVREIPPDRKSFSRSAERLRTETVLVFGKPPEIATTSLPIRSVSLFRASNEQLSLELVTEKEGYACGYPLQDLEQRLADEFFALAIRRPDAERLIALGPFFHEVRLPGTARRVRTVQRVLDSAGAKLTKNTGYFGHALHPYVGKFYPQIIRQLAVSDLVTRGYDPQESWILDPFLGSGTTLVEGALVGLGTRGIDLNPIAVLTAHAKRSMLREGFARAREESISLQRDVARLAPDLTLSAWGEDQRKAYLCQWFPLKQLAEISAILRLFKERFGSVLSRGSPFFAILSSVLRDSSLQLPSDLRIRRRPATEVDVSPFAAVRARLSGLITDLERWQCAAALVPHSLAAAAWRSEIHHGDTRFVLGDLPPGALANVRTVVTSPPYVAALPYIDTDRLSIAVLELDSLKGGQRALEELMIGNREISGAERRASISDIKMGAHADLGSALLTETLDRLVARTEAAGANAGFRRQNNPAIVLEYFRSMRTVLRTLAKGLQSGTTCYILVAGNTFSTGTEEIFCDTPTILEQIAEDHGWRSRGALGKELTSVNQRNLVHRKARAMSEESIVRLELS